MINVFQLKPEKYNFHCTYIKIVYFMKPLIQRDLILFYIEYFALMFSSFKFYWNF